MTDKEFVVKVKELVPGISHEAAKAIYGIVAEEKCRAYRDGYEESILKNGREATSLRREATSLRRELAQVRGANEERLGSQN